MKWNCHLNKLNFDFDKFLTMLQIVLIGLKLGNVITAPWIIVLIPFWIDIALFIVVAIFLIIWSIRNNRRKI